MSIIAQHPYVKVIRTVSFSEQTRQEEQRMLTLYADRLTTRHREFTLDNIHDMSYRPLGKTGGIFYLHTSSGLFTYQVKDEPTTLIEQFQQLKQL